MSDRDESNQRVSEIDEKLRRTESGADEVDDDEVSRLTEERESLLNRLDDDL